MKSRLTPQKTEWYTENWLILAVLLDLGCSLCSQSHRRERKWRSQHLKKLIKSKMELKKKECPGFLFDRWQVICPVINVSTETDTLFNLQTQILKMDYFLLGSNEGSNNYFHSDLHHRGAQIWIQTPVNNRDNGELNKTRHESFSTDTSWLLSTNAALLLLTTPFSSVFFWAAESTGTGNANEAPLSLLPSGAQMKLSHHAGTRHVQPNPTLQTHSCHPNPCLIPWYGELMERGIEGERWKKGKKNNSLKLRMCWS